MALSNFKSRAENLAIVALVWGLTACGGGGGSSTTPPPPPTNNPVPTVTSLSPGSATAGGSGFTLTVNGSNFISSSVVNWNGSPRTTSFVNGGQLTASILTNDIAATGAAQVTVFNPAPGGGTSSHLNFPINGAGPSISSLSPASTAAGGAGFTLTVNGSNFNSATVVMWNGQPRTTTFGSRGVVTASIPSTDIAAVGISQVTAFNPGSDGGESAAQNFPIYIGLLTADIVYDSVGRRIYASVPASASSRANTITPIDPASPGTVGTSVLIGNDPGDLAISADGSFLYIGLNAASAVQRFNVATQRADILINLGNGTFGPMYAEDLEVMQDNPRSFAVARKFLNHSPRNAGVAVFDDAFRRATTTAAGSSANVIQLCSSASVLFGLNVGDGPAPGFYMLNVDPSGVTATGPSAMSGSDFGFGVTSGGEERIFSTSGQVLAVATRTIVHTFQATGLVRVVQPPSGDSTAGRVFFLTQSAPDSTTWNILAFDINTLSDVPIGTLALPGVNGNPTSLIRWGTNGLAFRTDAGQVFLITTSLLPAS